MDLLLKRISRKERYTIGRLYVDGKRFCDALEDTDRDLNRDGDLDDPGEGKIFGETAIPYGTYKVTITYSPRFKRELPLVHDVKHFEGIRIHPGNTDADTHGCILLGYNDQIGRVSNSRFWFSKLFKLMKDSKQKEFTLKIE